MNKGPIIRSFDGQFICKDEGNESQDYHGCAYTITQYNAAKAAETAVINGSRVYVETRKNEAMAKADPNDPLAMLELQKQVLQESANVAQVKAATKATLAGIIGGYASSNSRKSDFLSYCYNNMKNSGKDFGMGADVDTSSPRPLSARTACDLAAKRLKLTPNEAMVSKAQDYMAANLIGAAGAFGEGAIQDSAADRLQNAINKIRDQLNGAKSKNEQFFQADTQVSPCLENPNLEECGGKVELQRSQSALNADVSVDGGGRGISSPTDLNAGLPTDSQAKRSRNSAIGSNGKKRISGVARTRSRDNSLTNAKAGANAKSNRAGGAPGNAGGGGAPGIGGGGGGGNRAPRAGGSDGYRASARERSESNSFRFGGGNQGLGNNSKNNRSNPFRGLVPKGGGSTSYGRSPSGVRKKDEPIFKVISDTYDEMERQGRLFEYEVQ